MAASLREINAAIAARYDQVRYEPLPQPLLEPPRLMGAAALFGCDGRIGDVLDIGCGAGVELARLASHSSGRAVGFDLSRAAVEQARERCAPFGARAQLRHADILDVDAAELGQFDLVILAGVINFVPAAMRERLLGLVGACLRPGGVAVISYYAGTVPTLRANLHRMLQAAHIPTETPRSEIARARASLEALAARVPAAQPGRELLLAAIEQTLAQEDVVFFHEVLGRENDALQTSALEQAMRPFGVAFLSYLDNHAVAGGASSAIRAAGADTIDYMFGSYHHALFGRPATDGPADVRDPRLTWRTSLRREQGAEGAPPRFRDAERQLVIECGNPLAAALVDELIDGPAGWKDAAQGARGRLGLTGPARAADLDALAGDLVNLLHLNAVAPVVATVS